MPNLLIMSGLGVFFVQLASMHPVAARFKPLHDGRFK
jgi:hypothetical protein